MSYRRQHLGKREREAGKRHRRAIVCYFNGAEWETLKLGRGHFRRWSAKSMCVANVEKHEHTCAGDLP